MKTLKKFDFAEASARNTYDWDKFLDGGIHQLEAGRDYECKDQTMLMLARKQSHKRGRSFKGQKVEGGVVIQAGDEGTYTAPPKSAKDEGGEDE